MTSASNPVKVGSHNEKDVYEVSIESPVGVKIVFLSYGALIKDWQVPVSNEEKRPVVLGFDSFEHYPKHSPYFGAIIGRVANRIGNACFQIDGREYRIPKNEPPNHLHGGPDGFGTQVWDLKVLDEDVNGNAIQFTLTSSNGHMGYPGNLNCSVIYRLNNYHLTITLEASTDAPTPINLTQHNYFNLEGKGNIADHLLQICASKTLELGSGNLPTGEIIPITGTQLDFRQFKQLKNENGQPLSIDNSFVLDSTADKKPNAVLKAPDRKLKLKMWTDQPSIHVYTASSLNVTVSGLNNTPYPQFGAICLEDQNFVDAVNHANFPSCILRPSELYKHVCEIEIKPTKK